MTTYYDVAVADGTHEGFLAWASGQPGVAVVPRNFRTLPKPPADEWWRSEPEARITRRGRWLYGVNIHYGGMCNSGDWICFGRRHAQSKARRALAKHLRRRAWEATPTIIKAGRQE